MISTSPHLVWNEDCSRESLKSRGVEGFLDEGAPVHKSCLNMDSEGTLEIAV
jgi:hypothetical protein